MIKSAFRLAVSLLLFTAGASSYGSTENVNGTYGDVIVNGDANRFSSGVVLRSKSTRPWISAQTGGTTLDSGFVILDSANSELLRVRSDGVIGVGGYAGSSWGAALSPSIEHVNSSLSFGDNTEIMLTSNAYYTPYAEWRRRQNAQAANYYQMHGAHFWRVAPAQPSGSLIQWKTALSILESGEVGVSTLWPQASLHVNGGMEPLRVDSINGQGMGMHVRDLQPNGGIGNGVELVLDGNSKISVANMVIGGATLPTVKSLSSPLELNTTGGQPVQIGSTSVNANLVVNGSVTATKAFGAVYQDVAEWVPSDEVLTDATVVVVASDANDHVVASTQPYDARVAGVVSPNPGLLLGVGGEGKFKIATTGRVKVKVDASKHAISRGDLLVTSAKTGMAMKSIPVEIGGAAIHRPGTIIGKALEPLASGDGQILVLLSLQ